MDKLTINQTALCLNISRQSVMKWLASGKFPSAEKDVTFKWWLIPIDEVEAERQKLIKKYERKLARIAKHANEFAGLNED
jgi:hypothetical protein